MAGSLIALGPGKVDLLEAIEREGSISQAARSMELSYRRAWDMVETMNQCFKKPLVKSVTGGSKGGGAQLTDSGKKMIVLFRSMEKQAETAMDENWQSIRKALKVPMKK
jgi:molybdate transport system regulatory protein